MTSFLDFSTTGFLEEVALVDFTVLVVGFLMVDEEDLVISLKGGEGGRGGDEITTGGSSFGITTGGGGTTFGIGAHVRGTVVVAGVVAVVVLDEVANVVFTLVAGRLLG